MAGVALALFCTFLLALPTTAYGANLTVNIEPFGAGIVTADGTPITPGIQMWFEDDAIVTLIAVPYTDFVFGTWEDGGVVNPFSMVTTVVMDTDKVVTAVFWATYTLTVAVAPEGAGSVSCTPDQPNHVEGTVVVLTATALTGFQFSHWTGSVQGVPNVSANPLHITMTANKSVTAVFLPIAPSTPVPANGATGVPACTTLSWRGSPVDDNQLVNGGFEDGDSTGWTRLPGPGPEPTDWTVNSGSTTGSFGNGKPAEGSHFAQNSFEGTAGVSDELLQEVQINTGFLSVSLSWLDRSQWDLASGGASQPRHHEVRLQPAGGGPLLATLDSATLNPGTAGDTGYVSHSVDLLEAVPGILGQYVRITFLGIRARDSHRPAQFDLDGVSLIGGAASPTTYDVYLGTDRGAMFTVCTGARTRIFGPGSLNPATKYYWQVRAKNDYGEVPSPIWSFTTSSRGDLVFLESPQSGWVEEGQLLKLNVTVSGAASPLYQWFKDGEPLPGGTESEYSIPAVTDEDAGRYSCRVRDESIDVYDESPRALIVVFRAGTLPTASVTGLCIAALVSVALGAVLIWRRRRPMPS
jgi:hypothetical protein